MMKSLVERLTRVGIPAHQVRGCSDSEIAEVQNRLGIRLPEVYREFLATMGRGAGPLFQGDSIFYPNMLNHRREIEYIIVNEEMTDYVLRLPDDAVAFLTHQGYEFFYFSAGEGEDPAVYSFRDGALEATKCFEHLSDFFDNAVSTLEGVCKSNRG